MVYYRLYCMVMVYYSLCTVYYVVMVYYDCTVW